MKTEIEQGRIRLCPHLLVSVNRSWQVETIPGHRPVAAFKAMAPLAPHPSAQDDGTDRYLAAVAAYEAYWLGFEADDGHAFAVTIDIDGVNAIAGRSESTATLQDAPVNYLLAPDQPWLDVIAGPDGHLHQLLPDSGAGEELGAGVIIVLTAYAVTDRDLSDPVAPTPQDPQPLYGTGQSSANRHQNPLLWPGRTLRAAAKEPLPCGRIIIEIIAPDAFQAATGTTLPAAMFDDSADPPAPFDPFQ